MIIVNTLFWKSFAFKIFLPTKRENRCFQIPPGFEEHYRKAPFSCRISVDGRPNRRNKAAFPNFTGVVWTGRYCTSVISASRNQVSTILCDEFEVRNDPVHQNEDFTDNCHK